MTDAAVTSLPAEATPPTFWRSPRLVSDPPRDKVEICDPPPRPTLPSESVVATLLPIGLTVGIMLIIGAVSGQSNMVLFSVPLILVSGIAFLITYQRQRRDYRRKMKEREQQYAEYLNECENRLAALQKRQRQVLLAKNPGPEECGRWASGLERRLWSAAPNQQDFLALRLGLGTIDATMEIKAPEQQSQFDPDPLVASANELAGRYRSVANCPVFLDLKQVGLAGLTGERSVVLEGARALALQIASHHAPDEVKLVVVYPEEEEAEWAWIRWLPHVWSDDHHVRYVANRRESAHTLLKNIDLELNRRQNRRSESHSSAPMVFSPQLVVMLAARALIDGEPVVQRLQTEGASLGAYTIFLEDRFKSLPKDCQAMVKLLDQGESFINLAGPRTTEYFAPDRVSRELASQFAREVAPIRLRQAATADLPASLSFLDMHAVRTVEDLHVAERWQLSQASGRSLAAPIGVKGGGEPLVLDLHERVHGPNGLVAGMVGTGKSELLQTLVASLAVNFHPHRLAFVLVDYKGGGMAHPFRNLPHSLGSIDNLQKGNLAARAIRSFMLEAERRQALLIAASVDHDVTHIDEYQRLFYRGQVTQPMPYLVIIVDEFAEMKTEQPEIARDFVRLARIGRSLGFRLILAMQKPEGIVDGQIEANTRFRLCLRVAQTADSQAMLKRPDAAALVGTGRAYFQVGVNEVFDLFQAAWCGAPYDPAGAEDRAAREIHEVALDGSRRCVYSPPSASQMEAPTQLRALIDHLSAVAKDDPSLAGRSLQRLWLEPLPEHLTLDEARLTNGVAEGWDKDTRTWRTSGQWLNPVVGRMDDPAGGVQDPFRVNLGKGGHFALYGAPGYGKTTFVQTLVMSLAMNHSPDDVNVYLLDFGGRFLNTFEGLPHVGGVIVADESERLGRFLRFLAQNIERRKQLFGAAGALRLPAYRLATGDRLPAIVTVLDNYEGFIKTYEDFEDTLAQIVREGGSYGVHIVLTAHSPASVRFRVSSNITAAAALNLGEQGDYGAVVGPTQGLTPAPVPGRGLVKAASVLEFQTALPVSGSTDYDRSVALKDRINDMAAAWSPKPKAPPVPMLPDIIPLGSLLQPDDQRLPGGIQGTSPLSAPIGLVVDDLSPFVVDLNQGPNFLVVGSVQSGKTTLLQTWLLALSERCTAGQVQIYVLDSRRRGLADLRGMPLVHAFASETDEAVQVLAEVERLVAERKRARDESFRKPASSALARQAGPAILVVVDDLFDRFDDITFDDIRNDQCRQALARIAQQGRRLGFYLIVGASTNDLSPNLYNEPAKTLKMDQTGFVMGMVDDSVFNLRGTYGKVLPAGEAYWTQRGQSLRVKIAMPSLGEHSVAEWVELLRKREQVTKKRTTQLAKTEEAA